jgi:hypothetical protein
MTAYQPMPAAPTPANTHTPPETAAERHRAAYAQRPAARPSLWAKLRPCAIGAAFGLAIGGAAVGYASYRVMPPIAQHVQNVFVNINGRPAVILSGDVVFDSTPLPSAQP